MNINVLKSILLLTFIFISYYGANARKVDLEVEKKLVDQGYKSKLSTHKLSTIKRRIGSLSVYLEMAKFPNHCHSKELGLLLNKLTKKYGSSKAAGKAITKDILDDVNPK